MKVRTSAWLVVAASAMALVSIPAMASAAGSPPSQPTGVTLTSGNQSLGVSWLSSGTGSITYTATATAAGHATRSCRTNTALSCRIVALTNGVVYAVSVVAKNSFGSSAASTPVTEIVGVPGRPLSVHATAGTASAVVMWAPPLASGVSAITSYMATANPGGFSCSTQSPSAGVAPARSCTIAGLTKGSTYTVSVTATNAKGTGLPSKTFSVTSN